MRNTQPDRLVPVGRWTVLTKKKMEGIFFELDMIENLHVWRILIFVPDGQLLSTDLCPKSRIILKFRR